MRKMAMLVVLGTALVVGTASDDFDWDNFDWSIWDVQNDLDWDAWGAQNGWAYQDLAAFDEMILEWLSLRPEFIWFDPIIRQQTIHDIMDRVPWGNETLITEMADALNPEWRDNPNYVPQPPPPPPLSSPEDVLSALLHLFSSGAEDFFLNHPPPGISLFAPRYPWQMFQFAIAANFERMLQERSPVDIVEETNWIGLYRLHLVLRGMGL